MPNDDNRPKGCKICALQAYPNEFLPHLEKHHKAPNIIEIPVEYIPMNTIRYREISTDDNA